MLTLDQKKKKKKLITHLKKRRRRKHYTKKKKKNFITPAKRVWCVYIYIYKVLVKNYGSTWPNLPPIDWTIFNLPKIVKWHDFWLQPNLNLRFAASKVHVQLPEIATGRFMLLCFLVQAVWDPKSVNSPSEWLYSLHFSNAIQELWILEPFVSKLLTKSASLLLEILEDLYCIS